MTTSAPPPLDLDLAVQVQPVPDRRRPDGTLGPVPIDQRLWSRIALAGACWEFTGHRTADGYGTVRYAGRMQKAHRVAYEITIGAIPAGLVVMHSCDNPPCINPAHLSVGTVTDNNRDRQAKGRTRGLLVGAGAAAQARKTHCPQGHPYSGENLRLRPNGRRRCAACARALTRRQRASSKES